MRKTKFVQIQSEDKEDRDRGKIFFITEMPAAQAEAWGHRALLAIGRANVNMPADLSGTGMAGLFILGLQSLISASWSDVEPLMEEMFECVQICPSPEKPDIRRRLLPNGDDIEEVRTRLLLRSEVFALHTDFSVADFRQTLEKVLGLKLASSTTQTYPDQLAQ